MWVKGMMVTTLMMPYPQRFRCSDSFYKLNKLVLKG